MTFRIAAALVLLLCVGGFGLAGSINSIAMVDAVNAKLPQNKQFNYLGWYFTKTQRLHREYRRLYPTGTLLRRQGMLAFGMLTCVVLAAWLLGFGVFVVALFGGGGALMLWLTYFRRSPQS